MLVALALGGNWMSDKVSRLVPLSFHSRFRLNVTGCIDEFDVFMDAVNRRISTKLMVRRRCTARFPLVLNFSAGRCSDYVGQQAIYIDHASGPQRERVPKHLCEDQSHARSGASWPGSP